jgi:hypothetical protein
MSRTWQGRLAWFFRPSAGGLLILFLWATVEILAEQPDLWWKLCLVWLLIGSVATWAAINRRREKKEALADWNSRAPDSIVVTAEGVAGETSGKTTERLPWSAFKSWREGKSVFLLRLVKGNRAQPLPKTDLTDQQIQELRGMFDLFLRAGR